MPSAERDTVTAFRLTRCGMHVSSTFQTVVKLNRNDVIGQMFEFPSLSHINACHESFAGLLEAQNRFAEGGLARCSRRSAALTSAQLWYMFPIATFEKIRFPVILAYRTLNKQCVKQQTWGQLCAKQLRKIW